MCALLTRWSHTDRLRTVVHRVQSVRQEEFRYVQGGLVRRRIRGVVQQDVPLLRSYQSRVPSEPLVSFDVRTGMSTSMESACCSRTGRAQVQWMYRIGDALPKTLIRDPGRATKASLHMRRRQTGGLLS